MEKQESGSGVSNFSNFMKGKNNSPNYEVTKKYIEVDGEIISINEEFTLNGDQKLTLENNDKLLVNNKKIGDDNNYDNTFALPSYSKQHMEDKVYQVGPSNYVEDDIKGVRSALLKKANAIYNEPNLPGRKQPVLKHQLMQKQSDEQDYEQLHQRILKLIQKEKKLYDENEPEPLYWCLMGSDYSYFTDILVEAVSKDLLNFSSMEKKGQDTYAIQIKHRIDRAHELLLMIYDCYKLIHHRINEFRKQYAQSRFYSTHLRITNLGYEAKMKLIEKQIEDLNNL